MSELTPERIRDARETVRQVFAPFSIGSAVCQVLDDLLQAASELERERAAEAKREKRIEELAREVYEAGATTPDMGDLPKWSEPIGVWGVDLREYWLNIARALLDRYPALAEAVEE